MKLKINGELQTITFQQGENVITLKEPYKYNNGEIPYKYSIDLNYYTIGYFD